MFGKRMEFRDLNMNKATPITPERMNSVFAQNTHSFYCPICNEFVDYNDPERGSMKNPETQQFYHITCVAKQLGKETSLMMKQYIEGLLDENRDDVEERLQEFLAKAKARRVE